MAPQKDELLQQQAVEAATGPQPTIVASFDAIEATGYVPPDVSAAVGPDHYVEMVNSAMAIHKKDGTMLLGPADINVIWNGFGGRCESQNSGDPIVRYDRLADRWLISQFSLPDDESETDYYQCIAVSKGSNPISSGWHLYAFPTKIEGGNSLFPDFPKIAVWPDGYYMGTQQGYPNGGLDVWVFERKKMLDGLPARQIHFGVSAPSLFLMPSDPDGLEPPKGAPALFLRHVDGDLWGRSDRLEVFELAANWKEPAKSTFKLAATVQTAGFNATFCGDDFSSDCIPQPGTTQKLDPNPAWLAWRAQYRNFGSYQTLVGNHTVNVEGDRAGIRWFELRKTGTDGQWAIHQQGTHSPDGLHRWMGSIAMDEAGNIALGYSVASETVFPSIRIATRRQDDPLNSLTQGELFVLRGAGSQIPDPDEGYPNNYRWGDYTTMDVDPSAPCTFWYTNQYYAKSSAAGWKTRAIAVKMPTCGKN